jgi:hypothetical protein
VALVVLLVPLVVGYGHIQGVSFVQLSDYGFQPSPLYYGLFPLQGPRLLVLSLFALDVGTWIALFMMLPIDERGCNPYEAARRRLRRRWLWAHAPIVSIVAILVGARLHAYAVSSSGAGAVWFAPRALASGEGVTASAWIAGELVLLGALILCFGVHVSMLAGIVRPGRWLRNMAVALVSALGLTLVSYYGLLRASDGGLFAASNAAAAYAAEVCPGAEQLPLEERIRALYGTFSRTSVDSPALRDLPYALQPLTVTSLPPLALIGMSGIAVELVGVDGSLDALRPGQELRTDATGKSFVSAGPGVCLDARVLKMDRSLEWSVVRPLLDSTGPGRLHLAFRSASGQAVAASTSRPPRLHLLRGNDPLPDDAPRTSLPLGFQTDPGPAPSVPGGPAPRAEHAQRFRHVSLPQVLAPRLSNDGSVALMVREDTPWDDVLRGLAAASLAGARDVYIAPIS